MKNLIISKSIEAFLTLTSIFMLGMLPSLLVSLTVVIFTKISLPSCIMFAPFWIITVIGWFVAAVYMNDAISSRK